MDTSPTDWSFRLQDTSLTGHFAYWTVCLLFGHFAYKAEFLNFLNSCCSTLLAPEEALSERNVVRLCYTVYSRRYYMDLWSSSIGEHRLSSLAMPYNIARGRGGPPLEEDVRMYSKRR